MTIDAKTRSRIRSALRKISQWTEAVRSTRARARISRGKYRCELCGKFCKKVDIDHIKPVGSTPGSKFASPNLTWDEFLNNMFCDGDNLRAICKPCHRQVTAEQRKRRGTKKNNKA